MTDELNKLKKAFSEAPEIKPSPEAKKVALNAAMSAFEVHAQNQHQGNIIDERPIERDNKLLALLTLSKWRKPMNLNYVLPGLAGLAALSLIVINTQQFQGFYTDDPIGLDRSDSKIGQIVIKEAKKDENENGVGSLQTTTRPLVKELSGKLSPAKNQPSSQAFSTMMNQSMSREAVQGTRIASLPVPQADGIQLPLYQAQGRDKFEKIETSPLKLTQTDPVSTFSIDVDTASYSFMRASLNRNTLPPQNSVRVEELINYFPYNYPTPVDKSVPFKVSTAVIPTPWNPHTRLMHIGIKGYEVQAQAQPRSNLVFLLDTSGSMNQANKLPLLINSFKLLLSTLSPEDTVAIVSYAGSAGTVLEPTKVKNKSAILNALSRLNAGGSTAGGEGIQLAYQLAAASFDPEGINRVILATDGDFNVGISDQASLKGFIERKRESGIFLSILGFGMGNYNDALMQTLAQNGNGNAAYIDSLSEARKVLVEEASSTLFTIAKDVKIQMEFNPATVSEYRLIGYETRELKREDFNNDKVDAGDIGAGHTVTAIYEITPTDSAGKLVDELRYQSVDSTAPDEQQSEYGFLKIRYKLPDANTSKLIQSAINIEDTAADIASASNDVRFATAVAAYGQLLRSGEYIKAFQYDDVIALAQAAKAEDRFGYRSEFITLVRLAKTAEAMQSR